MCMGGEEIGGDDSKSVYCDIEMEILPNLLRIIGWTNGFRIPYHEVGRENKEEISPKK